jgi:hypothetical protein
MIYYFCTKCGYFFASNQDDKEICDRCENICIKISERAYRELEELVCLAYPTIYDEV